MTCQDNVLFNWKNQESPSTAHSQAAISLCHLTQVSWIGWEATGVIFDSKYQYFVSYIIGSLFLWFSKAIRLEVIRTTICYSLTLWCCQTEWWLLLIIFRNGSYLKEYPRHSSMLRLSTAPLKSPHWPTSQVVSDTGEQGGGLGSLLHSKEHHCDGSHCAVFLRSRWTLFCPLCFWYHHLIQPMECSEWKESPTHYPSASTPSILHEIIIF